MSAVESTRTSVVRLDLGNTILCMEISKGKNTNLVLLSHEYVVIVDRSILCGCEPFVKLAKMYNSHNQAYDEWLRVIGKMCKKDCTSKYFDNPVMGEHMSNGRFPAFAKDTIMKIAKTAVSAACNIE